MSRSSYIRYFKKIFNSTPIDYIHNYRLRQSKALLKYTDAPLSSIAIDCGFYDSSHYGKLFREKYQMTPAQYRLASKNDGSKMGLSENSSLEWQRGNLRFLCPKFKRTTIEKIIKSNPTEICRFKALISIGLFSFLIYRVEFVIFNINDMPTKVCSLTLCMMCVR